MIISYIIIIFNLQATIESNNTARITDSGMFNCERRNNFILRESHKIEIIVLRWFTCILFIIINYNNNIYSLYTNVDIKCKIYYQT